MEAVSQPFLNVQTLLHLSQPRARGPWFWYAVGIFSLIVMGMVLLNRQSPAFGQAAQLLSGVLMLLLVTLLAMASVSIVKKHRAEQQRLAAASELVQLRRWTEAAMLLQQILSVPARTPQARIQALIYLSGVLARYHRFDDVIAVHNHLLEEDMVDPGTEHALKLGRAMAMLREDHLFDADRAISELRRTAARPAEPAADAADSPSSRSTTASQHESAGLALIEIYRDVKTGHPEEAIEIFNGKLPVLRDQLGHRIADAYALAARAYDLLGRAEEAQSAYEKATLLSPPIELHRRYPEVAELSGKYKPALAPAEAA